MSLSSESSSFSTYPSSLDLLLYLSIWLSSLCFLPQDVLSSCTDRKIGFAILLSFIYFTLFPPSLRTGNDIVQTTTPNKSPVQANPSAASKWSSSPTQRPKRPKTSGNSARARRRARKGDRRATKGASSTASSVPPSPLLSSPIPLPFPGQVNPNPRPPYYNRATVPCH